MLRSRIRFAAVLVAVFVSLPILSACDAGWEALESVVPSSSGGSSSDLGQKDPSSDSTSLGSTSADSKIPQSSAASSEPPRTNGSGVVDLFAAGDNILHQAVIDGGKTASGGYDYMGYYEYLAADIKKADIAFINQESSIGGEALGISGYPNFNSPHEIGDNLVSLGFDVVSQCNNHVLDKGVKGITATLNFWKKYPQIAVLGINESQQQRNTTRIIERNGIRFAFLGYTYGTNGYSTPSGQSYLVNRIEKTLIQQDVERAKHEADVIIASMHWGVEYSTTTSTEQHTYAQYLADLGVDLVIGTHPHVIQRVSWVTGQSGNKTLVYYSLGNFLSSQEEDALRMLGAVANVRFEKKNGSVSITDASVTPTICHYETNNGVKEHFKIYKLSAYTDTLAAEHGIKAFLSSFGYSMTLNNMKTISQNVLKDWYRE